MMYRLLPAPWLTLALFVMWLLLNRSVEAGHILLGLIFAVAAPALLAPLRPTRVRSPHPVKALRLFLLVGRDVIASNLHVFSTLIAMRRRPPKSCFVLVPLQMRDPTGLACLAIITTVVPGTVWCELARDSSMLLLHAWDVDDVDEFVRHYKNTYEKALMEIFEA